MRRILQPGEILDQDGRLIWLSEEGLKFELEFRGSRELHWHTPDGLIHQPGTSLAADGFPPQVKIAETLGRQLKKQIWLILNQLDPPR
jgi:hypothetical protein